MQSQITAMLNQALTLSAHGRLSEAMEIFRLVLAADPLNFDALHGLGVAKFQLGNLGEALRLFGQASAIRPQDFIVHYNQGKVLDELQRYQEALACYDRAASLEPRLTEAYFNRGTVLQKLQRQAEALASYERAIALKPGYAEAYNNRGNVLRELGRPGESLASYDRALALKSDYAEAHNNRGNVLRDLHRLEEALASYDRALALKPDLAEAHNNRGVTLAGLGRMDEAMRCLDRSLSLDPTLFEAYSAKLFTMLYRTATKPAELQAVHRQFAERCETPLRGGWRRHPNVPDPGRRLRIGYVSADFCRHSVARFIEPLLARHDHARFEVYCYYNNFKSDDVTVRIAALADRWLACAHLTDDQLAERIRGDGIDILVDLAGHTSGNRLPTFARKPAPVQVTYLGYPASTGLAAMDYRLCTADTDPPGQEAWHSEALYRLPHSLWCYRPLAAQARVPQNPPLMRNGYITFGSVNNVVKVSPETITAWARILQALPGSRLVMTSVPDGAVRQMLGRSISDHGIAPERVRMHDRLPHANYWQLLRQIDIALDPFPYAGTTTTCETLWMGVPVVTLIGETSVARSGFALLQCVGLAELAAADPADYVSRAVALANDPERLTRLHQELPARFDASALRDEAGLARDIETAFRKMWRKWCQTQQGQGGVNCRSCPDADAAHDLDLTPAVQLVVL